MNIQDEITKHVAKRAMAKIDLDKLAGTLVPMLQKSIRSGIISAAKHIDWEDWILDCVPAKELEVAVKKKLIAALKHL